LKVVRDVNKERKITIEFTEAELIILFVGYGATTEQKREEDYRMVFDDAMPNYVARVNKNNNLYNTLYEILVNPADVIRDNCYDECADIFDNIDRY